MQFKTKRNLMVMILTLLLGAVIVFLLQTSKDQRWGGGFWEIWLRIHWRLTPDLAHQLVFGLRKTIHFIAYGCLTLLFWWYFALWGIRRALPVWGLIATALVASFDEYNQAFSTFRSGQLTDVLLDCSGGIIFILGVYGVRYLCTVKCNK